MMRAGLQVWLFTFLIPNFLFSQIWSENFDALPNGTTEYLPKWTSLALDCDDGTINSGIGDSFWGVFDGRFVVNDIEGFPCCSGLGSGGGGNQNDWISEKIRIDKYCDVSISLEVVAEGSLECDSPDEAIFICTGLNPPDNSHDQVSAEYSLDGSDFQEFGYVCGSENTGILSVSGLNGDSLQVRIRAANTGNTEFYYLDNIQITGTLRDTTTFDLPDNICESSPPFVLPSLSNEGHAGLWNFDSVFDPTGFSGSFATLEFTPFEPECALRFTDFVEVLADSYGMFDTTICREDSIIFNGTTFKFGHTSGTEILKNENYLGCDSIVEVNILFYSIAESFRFDTICPTHEIEINGTIYNQNNPVGTEILQNASSNSCDSFIFVQLYFFETAFETFSPTVCENDFFEINGNIYDLDTPSGIEVLTNQSLLGCDSIIEIDLSFYSSIQSHFDSVLCQEDEILINGTAFNKMNPLGTEVFPNADQNGCDSTVFVNLSFYEQPVFEIKKKLCPSESIEINGTVYNQNNPFGTETFEDGSVQNCDSVVTISLSFFTSAEHYIDTLICQNSQLRINNRTFDYSNSTGTEILGGAAFNGCDSIVHVNLNFFDNSDGHVRDTLWENESLKIGKSVFSLNNPSGEVLLQNSDINNCDSIVYVDLFFLKKDFYIPNSFSPNQDGFNDRFIIYGGQNLTKIHYLKIFNRWGELVFEKRNLTPNSENEGWDGTFKNEKAPDGLYIFISEIEFGNGDKETVSGDFALIR